MNEIFQGIESSLDFLSKGGMLMGPIALCSTLALAIIVDRVYYFYKCREDPDALYKVLKENITVGDISSNIDLGQNSTGPVGRLLKVGLINRNVPKWKLEEVLSMAGQAELLALEKNIRGLEVIATITPLMGLLGTVIGMVKAFSKVAQQKGQVDPSLLAGGIWEALLTTAAGLAVAIPILVVLHYFDRRLERIAILLKNSGQLFIHYLDERCLKNNATKLNNDKTSQVKFVKAQEN